MSSDLCCCRDWGWLDRLPEVDVIGVVPPVVPRLVQQYYPAPDPKPPDF